MIARPSRIVDAHVHHWNPSRTEWYPYLAAEPDAGRQGDVVVRTNRRLYEHSTYLAEVVPWNVDKCVHVSAAVAPYFVDETALIDGRAMLCGQPNAIIGGIDPRRAVIDVLRQIERQSGYRHFRGVRAREGMDHGSPVGQAVLEALQDQDLVYDLHVQPATMIDAVRGLERFDSLTVVVEHAGHPATEDATEFKSWREGMRQLSLLGANVTCKISGLAQTLHTFDALAQRPWVDHCLEVFGVDRCLFASNFPVDSIFGSFDDLYESYDELTSDLSVEDRDKLFARNAERTYRC